MKHALMCALMTLLAVSATIAPADAATAGVSLHQPRIVDADSALLVGTARGRDVVRIQRFVPARNNWVTVRAIRTNPRGRFRTTVPLVEHHRHFRAVAGGRASTVRVVPAARPPEVEPEAPEEPETPTPGSDACGVRPVRADGSRWSCTLAEEFTGTELDRSLWTPQTAFATGTADAWACYQDDPSVISVHDGALHLTVRKLPESIACHGQQDAETHYVAGMVSTYRLFSQQYGRFEARFKNTATTAPGLHEAFWLWPDDRYSTTAWPAAGEIDIAETYSQYSDLAIPFLHYSTNDNDGPVAGLNTAWNCTAPRGEFNTYTLEWTATRLEILVNGKTCLVNTSGDPAFQKPYIVALTQALGATGNQYDGRASLPATMTIDYVRAWE